VRSSRCVNSATAQATATVRAPQSLSLRLRCGNSLFQGWPHSTALYGVQNLSGPNCEKSNEVGFLRGGNASDCFGDDKSTGAAVPEFTELSSGRSATALAWWRSVALIAARQPHRGGE
jgi:hypothetical protein